MKRLFFVFVLAACSGQHSSVNITKLGSSIGVVSVPSSWSVPFWFIDPSNITTCASDSNSCTSATCGAGGVGPCLTHSQIVVRLQSYSPTFSIAVVETQLSDQQAPWNDPVYLSPSFIAPAGSFLYQGSIIALTTQTIGSFTPVNKAAGTLNKITATGQSGSFWTTYIGDIVHDTTAGAWFAIENDLGSATAQITTPLQPGFINNVQPALVTIAGGDTIVVGRQTYVNMLGIKPVFEGSVTLSGISHVYLSGPVGPNGLHETDIGDMCLIESREDANGDLAPASPGTRFEVNNVYDGYVASKQSTYWGGALVGTTPVLGDSKFGGLYAGVIVDPLHGAGVFRLQGTIQIGDAYFGVPFRAETPDLDGANALIMIGNYDSGSGVLYGPSTLDLHDRSTLICYGGCTANLLLTGTLSMHGATTGFPWLPGSHAWGAPVTITAAAIDANNGLFDPRSGDGFMNHP